MDTNTTRANLTAQLNALDNLLPTLIAEHRDLADFWKAFSIASAFVREADPANDSDWINSQIDGLLFKHGVTVPDGTPVDDW